MDDSLVSRIPFIILKIVLKCSGILLIVSLAITLVSLWNITTSFQVPLNTIDNAIKTNNFVTDTVAVAVTGNSDLTVDYNTPNMISNLKTPNIISVTFENSSEIIALNNRNYGDRVSYRLTVRFMAHIWTLFGSVNAPINYTFNRDVVCLRKVR